MRLWIRVQSDDELSFILRKRGSLWIFSIYYSCRTSELRQAAYYLCMSVEEEMVVCPMHRSACADRIFTQLSLRTYAVLCGRWFRVYHDCIDPGCICPAAPWCPSVHLASAGHIANRKRSPGKDEVSNFTCHVGWGGQIPIYLLRRQ